LVDRKSLSKRTRFEVFKRDGFTCQYCGSRPPDIILHCDHIDPVCEGGTDDIANLITSCADCNLGKGGIPLGDLAPTPDTELARLERMQELAELRAYQDVESQYEELVSSTVESLCDIWCRVWVTSYAPDTDIEAWVRQYGPQAIHAALSSCCGKHGRISGNHSRKCYVGAILRNQRNRDNNRICETCRHMAPADGEKHVCLLKPDTHKDGCYFQTEPFKSCRNWSE
jgi:hypothetical protein